MELNKDTVAYRAWHPEQAKEFGAFWSLDRPAGSLQTRIDSALLPEWVSLETTQSKGSKLLSIPWLSYLKAQRSILVKSDLKEEYGLVAGVSF